MEYTLKLYLLNFQTIIRKNAKHSDKLAIKIIKINNLIE